MKILKYLFTFLLISLFLTGCAHKKAKTIVNFSSWGSKTEIEILKPLISDFEKENPDIKVDFQHIPDNYFQKLQLLFASNLPPDVIFINNINGVIYEHNDLLEDLSPYLNNDKTLSKSDFFSKATDSFTYKNKLYAIPRDISNLVIYYNKDIFDKYGIAYPKDNWNFDEYLKTAQKLTKDNNNDDKIDIFGAGFSKNSLFWLPFLWSNGGGILTPELDKIIINSKDSIDSIQFYADLRNKYHVEPKPYESGSLKNTQMFIQGKIAMHLSGRWEVPRLRSDATFKWDIAKFPEGKNGSIVDADTSGWAMSKSCQHKQAAWRLISYLSSKKSITQFTKSGLIVPSRKDVASSDSFLSDNLPPKNSKIFIDIIPSSIPTPANQNYQEILDNLDIQLEPVWTGQKQAKDVITPTFMKKLNELL